MGDPQAQPARHTLRTGMSRALSDVRTAQIIGVAAMQNLDSQSSSSRLGSCGLIKWCYSMSHFAMLPFLQGAIELLVITNDEAAVQSLCVSATAATVRLLPLDRSLEPLITNWTRMLNRTQYSLKMWTKRLSLRALYKLQLFRLTEYRAILFTDVDVDPFLLSGGRPPTARTVLGRDMERAWRDSFQRFLSSPARLLASADYHSPINTGVMLLKPNLAVYDEGVSVLSRGRFDPLLGFDWVGRPRDALAHLHDTSAWDRINRTGMLRKNDWNFVGGHACQGLFVYLFLVRSDASMKHFAFPKNLTFRLEHNLGTMRVRHFHSGFKPWRGPVRCPLYFDFFKHSDAHAGHERDAFCWPLLQQKHHCLSKELSRPACAECRKMKYATTCGGKKEQCRGSEVLVY